MPPLLPEFTSASIRLLETYAISIPEKNPEKSKVIMMLVINTMYYLQFTMYHVQFGWRDVLFTIYHVPLGPAGRLRSIAEQECTIWLARCIMYNLPCTARPCGTLAEHSGARMYNLAGAMKCCSNQNLLICQFVNSLIC